MLVERRRGQELVGLLDWAIEFVTPGPVSGGTSSSRSLAVCESSPNPTALGLSYRNTVYMFLRKVSPMMYSGRAGPPGRCTDASVSRLKMAPRQLPFASTRPRLKSAGETAQERPPKVNAISTWLLHGNWSHVSFKLISNGKLCSRNSSLDTSHSCLANCRVFVQRVALPPRLALRSRMFPCLSLLCCC